MQQQKGKNSAKLTNNVKQNPTPAVSCIIWSQTLHGQYTLRFSVTEKSDYKLMVHKFDQIIDYILMNSKAK